MYIHASAIGNQTPKVDRPVLGSAHTHDNVWRTGVNKLQGLPSREHSMDARSLNDDCVAHRPTAQPDTATKGGIYDPLVRDRARPCSARMKIVLARHEIDIGNIQGGCHKPANINTCILAEQNAMRIDQPDTTI